MNRIYRRAASTVGALALGAVATMYGCREDHSPIEYTTKAPLDTLCNTAEGTYTAKTIRSVNVHGDSALDLVMRIEGQKQQNGTITSCTTYEVFIKRGNEYPNAPKYAQMLRDSARTRNEQLKDSARQATEEKIRELQLSRAKYDSTINASLAIYDNLENVIDEMAIKAYDQADNIKAEAIKRDEPKRKPAKKKSRR